MVVATLFGLVAVFLASLLRQAHGDLNVIALGDWGGDSDDEPTTLSQRLVGKAMMREAAAVKANFTIMMGDNMYYHGVGCAAENSHRFHSTFEEVYARLLPGHPFYVLAGNHDYGEGKLSNVSAQLAYSTISGQWRFPSLWYTIHREFEARDGRLHTVDFIVIDTVVLCGNGLENEAFIDRELEFVGGKADAGKPGALRVRLAKQHWEWLEQELNQSSANFLWVTGHYPIWSSGDGGSNQCLIDQLFPLLRSHGAHYIAGHDHQLSHILHQGTNMFVVGAGKECCYNPDKAWQVPTGALQFLLAGPEGSRSTPQIEGPVYGGYASMNFQAESVSVVLRDHNGDAVYKAPPIPARSVQGGFVKLAKHALAERDTILGCDEPLKENATWFVSAANALVVGSIVIVHLAMLSRLFISRQAQTDYVAKHA